MPRLTPFFLHMGQGDRFCILHAPDQPVSRGALLFVHPFAEELNRCRRMAALQARAFCQAGWTVLQIDLFGCGDSVGDFGDASWAQWLDDTVAAAAWLQRETGHVPVWWGLRTGCLLVTEAAKSVGDGARMVLWQPVVSGDQFLQQFLRLKVGTQVVGSAAPGATRMTIQQLRDQLATGQPVEVTGYSISPALAAGLAAAKLEPPATNASIAWLEVAAGKSGEMGAGSRMCLEKWRDGGHSVRADVVAGPAFWQTLEITECPALIDASLEAVRAW